MSKWGDDMAKESDYTQKELLDRVTAQRNLLTEQLTSISQEKLELHSKIAALRDALFWCSGSSDFQEGGIARKGWLKVAKLLEG